MKGRRDIRGMEASSTLMLKRVLWRHLVKLTSAAGHGVGNWGNPIEDYEKYEILKGDPMAEEEGTNEKVCINVF